MKYRITFGIFLVWFMTLTIFAYASASKKSVVQSDTAQTSSSVSASTYTATPAVTQAPVSTPQPEAIVSTASVPPAGDWTADWYNGADGYAKALAEYEKTNKPMMVYINVKWCPYCRKFEKAVLSDPEARSYMKDFIKVRVDPEMGQQEASIAYQYGVMGYPAFYLHPPRPGGTVRLYTGVSGQQFIELCQKVLK